MGINTHYYTVYGVKIDEYVNELSDELHQNNLYDTIKQSEELDIVMDGMGGEYTIIGKILFDSGDLRWNEINDTFVEINPAWLKSYRVKATNAFREYFPDHIALIETAPWKLMTLVHYS